MPITRHTALRAFITIIPIILAGSTLDDARLRAQAAVRCDGPLTESALQELVSAGVPAARLRQWLACGVESTARDVHELESRLKTVGVPAAALTVLSPPVNATPGMSWTSPLDGREMIFVAGGTAQIGSPATELGRDADETPHAVRVDGFWIDVAEVTNEAYRRFILNRPEWRKSAVGAASYLKDWSGTDYPNGAGANPVVSITWNAARAYAAWAGKRLPTEVEWEYAARAGTSTPFWWTSSTDRDRNPWGLLNTLGGVWEWTSSSYRPYPYDASDGREADSSRMKVVRGGSRVSAETFQRAANRLAEDASTTSDLLGFRCAR